VTVAEEAHADLGWVPAKPDLRAIVEDAWAFHRARHPST
jgi:UDP-glucose 4-epimerase